jgi:hypothetical protein
MAFQQVPDRLPVHPRGFHHRVGAALLLQPVGQLAQRRCRRLEPPELALDLLALGQPNTDHDLLPMHVQSCTPSMLLFHDCLLAGDAWRGAPCLRKADIRAHPGSGPGAGSIVFFRVSGSNSPSGSQLPALLTTSVPRSHPRSTRFHPPWVARQGGGQLSRSTRDREEMAGCFTGLASALGHE